MSQPFERATSRLNNLQSIEPLLGALRTISMGTWRMAQNKIAHMQKYERNYNHILAEILPEIKEVNIRTPKAPIDSQVLSDTIILILGTERGLCGKFNETLVENAAAWISSQDFSSYQIWAMGSRMVRTLERKSIQFAWRKPLPSSDLSSYRHSYQMTQTWLEQYESYEFNEFIILFNQVTTGGKTQFTSFKLLPYETHHPVSVIDTIKNRWPPPIIETDPRGIYHQIIRHYIASSFYQVLLKSAAAEHSFRYKLMEEAKQNTDEIIEELNREINAERKRQITQEMQELAVSAGLIDNK
jgi:F-type H+-transporting ATPase subunit gamma